MSQYPYPYGYGQYYGQHPPPPFTFPNIPGYHVSGQNTPYNPSAAQLHRDASQAAYDSNAIHIPGLGIGGTAPVGTQHNVGHNFAAWTQPPNLPAPPSSAPPPQDYGARDVNPQRSLPDAPGTSRNGAPPPSQPAPAVTRPTADVEMEEGELSEGQFEDLYEPREYSSDGPKQAAPKPLPPTIGDLSQPASAADTPEGGFYGSDEEDGVKDARGNEGRERSASYSPFLSPREIQSEVPTPQPTSEPTAARGPTQSANTKDTTVSGLQPSNGTSAAEPACTGSAHTGESASQAQKDILGSFKSLQEARKEAQKAILRLWPLGVKFQNYIEEGFDEKLIKGLFRDLHLDIPKANADSSAPQIKEPPGRRSGGPSSTKPSQSSDAPSQQATTATSDSTAMADQSRKGEERKDRIARLLAAKAAKAPAAPKPLTPAAAQPEQSAPEKQPQETATSQPTPAPPKGKTWGEKERLIQQKIAALQKSREAQKSATGTATPGPAQAGSNGTPASQDKPTASPAPLSVPAGPTGAPPSQTPANAQPTPPPARPLLPSLVPSPNTQPNAPNSRKRPVAMDFVEYPSGPTPPKRPFGQPRKESSLIIDVSDESDDGEMDMDMDMGSPVDETLPIQPSGTPGQRGPAIRDFPPLSDTLTHRRVSSPAPSVTPPSGLVNNKRRETELDLKEKAIQEMRRKIALAEARRKAKQSSGGSVTPKQGGPSSENGAPRLPRTESTESGSSPARSDRPSPQLMPEPSHLNPLQRAERRGRIVSLEIPRVKSTLSEKLKRLQQLQDEQARLKAEIDNGLAEEKRLAEELQQLEAAPPVETAPTNGSAPGSVAGNSPAPSQAVQETSDRQGPEPPVAQAESGSVGVQTTVPSSAPSTSIVDGSRGTGEAPRPEADSPQEQVHRESPPPSVNTSGDKIAESVSERQDNSAAPPSKPSKSVEPPLPAPGATAEGRTTTDAASSPTSPPAESNVPESGEADNADETTPMELDSRSSSPDAAEPASGSDAAPPAPLPEQISNVAQPREPVQEIEAEATAEVRDEPAAKPSSTLMPYESPLRYFHAYRFHPEYQRTVAGGLKSLTYSNRIDPEKELCPYELGGEQCPPGCEFQHFNSICPPDDQILLELGNPDDYSGEQKSRFIQGLRELLQKFKADKVKDFNTIARGIIEFRARLLGDRSKVLRLDGVTI